MRKSWAQLYAPFIVLAMIQALIIAVAPSRGGGNDQNLAALERGSASGGFATGSGSDFDAG